jgi:hypothetical protein
VEKLITETGDMVLKRTEFMDWIMKITYSSMAFAAVLYGFDNAWENEIATGLKNVYRNPKAKDHSKVLEILHEAGDDPISQVSFDKAARMILDSRP